jgi:Uma2 family endonuclease
MTQALEERTYTREEYLEFEVASEERHEYVNGDIGLMTGGTPNHLIDRYSIHVEHFVKTAANQWLLSEYSDLNVTLSLSTFEAQIEIMNLYENIDLDV